jgi:hypothetical protein
MQAGRGRKASLRGRGEGGILEGIRGTFLGSCQKPVVLQGCRVAFLTSDGILRRPPEEHSLRRARGAAQAPGGAGKFP